MMRKIASVLAFCLGLSVALTPGDLAWGQGYTIIPTPNGNEVISTIVPNTGGNQAAYLTSIRDAQGYAKIVPVTTNTIGPPGTTATFNYGPNISRLMIMPAGTIAALTVTLPGPFKAGVQGPIDGAEFCIISTQTITSLTMNVVAGQTLNNPLTTWATGLTAGVCWAYSASNTTWDRSS